MLVCFSSLLAEARPRRSSCALRRGARLADAARLRPGQGFLADVTMLGWPGAARGCEAASCGESLRGYKRAVWVMLAERLATLLLAAERLAVAMAEKLAGNACFAFAGCSRTSRRVPCADCLLA